MWRDTLFYTCLKQKNTGRESNTFRKYKILEITNFKDKHWISLSLSDSNGLLIKFSAFTVPSLY